MKLNILKTSLDIISVILFFILIIYLPDIDIQKELENIGINTTFKLTIVLVVLLSFAMLIYCYSKITGCVIFACTTLFLRTQFTYVETFQESTRTRVKLKGGYDNATIKNNKKKTKHQEELTVEEYLLNQISDDPNKTNLEKDLIKDITKKYFLNSDKLKKLTDFNEESEDYKIAGN